jgi:hypothetical protein
MKVNHIHPEIRKMIKEQYQPDSLSRSKPQLLAESKYNIEKSISILAPTLENIRITIS